MFRSFKKTDPLFYVGLVFMIFPLGGVVWFAYPMWTLIPTSLFGIAYLMLVHIKDRYPKTIACLWFYLLAYIIGFCLIEGSMMWFFFYMSNLSVWRFADDIRHYRSISYFMAIGFVSLLGLVFGQELGSKVMAILLPFFILTMHYFQRKGYLESKMQEEIYKQNETINLLAAENERNRIGRDLHDTLGHTFAMLSVKTELAIKQLDKGNLTAVQKELEDLNQISKTSMKEVRELITNLKYRTVSEELTAIQEMFELSGIDLVVEDRLNTSQLSPVIQSSMTMILRELATNIIKHAGAKTCHICFRRSDQLVMEVTDDGCGFHHLTGKELYSIRERLRLVKGEVTIVSKADPTIIRVRLEEGVISE